MTGRGGKGRGSRGRVLLAALGILAGMFPAGAQDAEKPSVPATETQPASTPAFDPKTQGMLTLALSGNRQFCVTTNEIEPQPGMAKPRSQKPGQHITTFGYKYQISVARRGSSSVTKLMESPVIRTATTEKVHPPDLPPQPRLPTPEDIKSASQPYGHRTVTKWNPRNRCTTLLPEYRFPLSPGRYDVYLGFDLLIPNGQWVPLQSDFASNVTVEVGRTTQVDGSVDDSEGVRTVKLGTSATPPPSGPR